MLRVTPPDGSAPATLGPPDLTQAPQLSLEQWASSSDGASADLAWGCVRGDVGQWSADATELAQGKLVELASSTLSRMAPQRAAAGLHVTAATTSQDGRVLEQTAASDSDARARTFVAFTEGPQAHACLVVCTNAARCGTALDGARVEGETVAPPNAGLALRALSASVHHPHAALGVVGAVIVIVAALALATRPRPPKKPNVAAR